MISTTGCASTRQIARVGGAIDFHVGHSTVWVCPVSPKPHHARALGFPVAIDSKLPWVGTTHLHGHVQARRRLRRDQPVAGVSRFPGRPLAVRRRASRHARRPQPVRADGRHARAAPGVADKVAALYGIRYDIDHEVTVTAGATQALFTAIAAFVRPGDEVIVFEPVYDSYVPAIETVGGKAIYCA